MVVGTIT